uniref:Uncharacterized protein n=1 Tax=Aegilops tauschii subsp. strangulata TaxID=200361 RepID=A0A453GEZ1_AEGTS
MRERQNDLRRQIQFVRDEIEASGKREDPSIAEETTLLRGWSTHVGGTVRSIRPNSQAPGGRPRWMPFLCLFVTCFLSGVSPCLLIVVNYCRYSSVNVYCAGSRQPWCCHYCSSTDVIGADPCGRFDVDLA